MVLPPSFIINKWNHIDIRCLPSEIILIKRVLDIGTTESYYKCNLPRQFVGLKIKCRNTGEELQFFEIENQSDTYTPILVSLGNLKKYPELNPGIFPGDSRKEIIDELSSSKTKYRTVKIEIEYILNDGSCSHKKIKKNKRHKKKRITRRILSSILCDMIKTRIPFNDEYEFIIKLPRGRIISEDNGVPYLYIPYYETPKTERKIERIEPELINKERGRTTYNYILPRKIKNTVQNKEPFITIYHEGSTNALAVSAFILFTYLLAFLSIICGFLEHLFESFKQTTLSQYIHVDPITFDLTIPIMVLTIATIYIPLYRAGYHLPWGRSLGKLMIFAASSIGISYIIEMVSKVHLGDGDYNLFPTLFFGLMTAIMAYVFIIAYIAELNKKNM